MWIAETYNSLVFMHIIIKWNKFYIQGHFADVIDCRTVQFVQSTKSDPNINSTVQMFYNSSNVDSPKPSTAQSGSQATNGLQNVIKSCKINKIKILGEIFILLFVFKPLHDFKQFKVRQFIEISCIPGKTRSKILVLSTALFE